MSAFDVGPADRAALLALARESILAGLERRRPSPPPRTPSLEERRGAFVTLHIHGRLRGCIGRMLGDLPLYDAVQAMAVAAAFEDPRFPPLSADEYPAVDLEISVLSPMEPCQPGDVVPGVHGVYLTKGYSAGVFLPQVAPEQGWDREALLDNLCRKAGLPPGSHLAPGAELRRFTAVVFGEKA